ncbi:MAG: DUF1622 domain-containing protein [Candidatus Bathyarchaeia archaeon]
MSKPAPSRLTITLLLVIAALAISTALLFTSPAFLPAPTAGKPYTPGGTIYEIISTLLLGATDVLYLLGGALVFFGAMLVAVKFVQTKLKNAYQPAGVTRILSGYLTLSLEIFIGAEIIKTTVTQSIEEFEVLVLVIVSRGLFSLILYLERRWHGTEEGE